MYDLLNEYSKLSGLHVLLNTSFNVGGESIVNNELDAILCFAMAKLDYLVLGDFLISKDDNIDAINSFLSETTLDQYFQARKRLYVNEFENFIKENEEFFSSSLTGSSENGGLIFREHKW